MTDERERIEPSKEAIEAAHRAGLHLSNPTQKIGCQLAAAYAIDFAKLRLALQEAKAERAREQDQYANNMNRACDRVEKLERALQESQQRVKELEGLQFGIFTWANETFGEATQESALRRLDQELAELFDDPYKESADVVILLFRLAGVMGFDLIQSVMDKMQVNRGRGWVLSGDGNGQHSGSIGKIGLKEERDQQHSVIQELAGALREAEDRLNWIADSGDCSMSDDSVIECRSVRDDIRAALASASPWLPKQRDQFDQSPVIVPPDQPSTSGSNAAQGMQADGPWLLKERRHRSAFKRGGRKVNDGLRS